MTFHPDNTNRLPVYQQIARHFEQDILKGILRPGDKLPAERKLAIQIGVNRTTVVHAYDLLRSCGIVTSVKGSGTCVAQEQWGVRPLHLPNWQDYANGGTFLPTLPIVQRLAEAKQQKLGINLSSSELTQEDYPISILKQICKELPFNGSLGYPDPNGYEPLRTALHQFMDTQFKMNTDPSGILVTSGAQQALLLITQCLLNPGEAIAVESPSYFYSLPLFHSAGLRMYGVQMDEEGLIPGELELLLSKRSIKMLFLNPTYQNPTGRTLTESRRKEVLAICEKWRVPIVEDDAYRSLELSDETQSPQPLFSLDASHERVIYIGSLSKTVAPGLRIGWIVAPEPVLKRLREAKYQMDHGSDIITQQIAEHYLRSDLWEKQVEQLRHLLEQRRRAMVDLLFANCGGILSFTVPKGGYHLWCRCTPNVSDTKLLEACIKQGVLIVPGTVYGAHPRFVRLSFACNQVENIAEGVLRFIKAIKQSSPADD
ncbi:PLP-dependent aminotransferase family protein [Sporolactobacillus sp. STSJ-5]|uniref:aminotransferase-like domain-containing protein n=1 Tax=Sporolactobacillus sp. STSJ-5 TaxID=2965076 RepID=UPI002103E381|nr:PLP-dependent aminotransferase family protein [Sporolactobacillus sp. STSJ-5]MCQ2010899.1 PLP-dependent aminotransferase family protein [Sporolactobacillus sp. STSJ-5]